MNVENSSMKRRKNTTSSQGEPERGKIRLALLIIVVLAAVIMWFWLERNPQSRESFTAITSSVTSRLTSSLPGMDTVLQSLDSATAAVKNLVNKVTGSENQSPTAPRIGATTGSALPGAPDRLSPMPTNPTLSPSSEGASVTGLMNNGTTGVPGMDGTLSETEAGSRGATERGALALPDTGLIPPDAGRQDDAVVRVAFIDDLAQWMVQGYAPSAKGNGKLNVSLPGANLRYGVGMKGLAWVGDDLPQGRSAALAYVFTPDMLNGLYRLYVQRFMEAMERAADKPSESRNGANAFTAQQKKDLFQQYARRFRGVSGALQSVGAMDDLTRRVDKVKAAAQQVVTANAHYSDLVFAQDEARENNNNAKLEALKPQLNTAGQTYQQSVINREQTRNAFAQSLRQNPAAKGLDDETLLYVAFWIDRRVRENPDKIDAALQAATLFLDLAQRFEQAAGVIE